MYYPAKIFDKGFRVKLHIAVLAALLMTASAHAQTPWAGPSGGGMLTVQEAATIGRGHFSFGLTLDNYDRDPLGLDIFDARVAWRLGVIQRIELYGNYQIARAISSPGSHTLLSPPVDIIIMPGATAPTNPYRAMYWPMPYLNHAGARVDEMTGGEYTIGTKIHILDQQHLRPALSISFQASIPGTYDHHQLTKGSGSGSVDFGAHIATTWSIRRLSVSTNLGFTKNGNLRESDQFIFAGTDRRFQPKVQRPDFLHTGLGLRFKLHRGISAIGEVSGWAPVGRRTLMQNPAGASDTIAGLEFRYKAVALTIGLRQHMGAPKNRVPIPTGPLAGAVDLSRINTVSQDEYLYEIGIDPLSHRPNTGLVIVGLPPYQDIPYRAKRLPETYQTHTTGNIGSIISLSFSF